MIWDLCASNRSLDLTQSIHLPEIIRGQLSVTNNGKANILTGADISVPISVFVSGMFGHFTWKITGLVPDVLKQNKQTNKFNI